MNRQEPKFQPHHLENPDNFKVRACNFCRTFTYDKLKVCGGCKTIYYCSSECQKLDWVKHKSVCQKMAGQGKLKHAIDSYTKNLKLADLPHNGSLDKLFGYVIQIKDTAKFLELVKSPQSNTQPLELVKSQPLNTRPLDDNNGIYVSFCWSNAEDFTHNFMFISDLIDMDANYNSWLKVFKDCRDKGVVPLVGYSHDLKHYCLDHLIL